MRREVTTMSDQHAIARARQLPALPIVRRIGLADVKYALTAGCEDFLAMPTHLIFLAIIYPVIGLVLTRVTMGDGLLPLVYPLMAGFTLLGPFAAIGLYELSRRRELGLDASWTHAFDVLRSPSLVSIALLGVLQCLLFVVWIAVANALYGAILGDEMPSSISALYEQITGTSAGWTLIVAGNGIGLLFAIVTLTLSVVSFPLLLDRNVGAAVALLTSVRAVIKNPLPMAVWGLVVAAAVLIGSIPFFIGLALVMPILGHATWHLYRRVIEPAGMR
jgi:uncharacterized membrane protein